MITPFFPALRPILAPMGSRSRTAARSLAQDTLLQIEERLSPALEADLLAKPGAKEHSRQRIFTLRRTFWCWIWQVLQANTSCREVVRQVQALFAAYTAVEVDEGTSAFCRARKKLAGGLLEKAFAFSHRSAEQCAAPSTLLQSRPLKFADGSGLRVCAGLFGANRPRLPRCFAPKNGQRCPSKSRCAWCARALKSRAFARGK